MYEKDGTVYQSEEEYLHELPQIQAAQQSEALRKQKKRKWLIVFLIAVFVSAIPQILDMMRILVGFMMLLLDPPNI